MKKIDRDTYLKALAMFTMGNQLYAQARELQLRMDEILQEEDGNCVDDAFYSTEVATIRDFNVALKRCNITFDPVSSKVSNGDQV